MDPLILEFQTEAQGLVSELTVILESIEDDYSQVSQLEKYGQIVDRIMGTAKTLIGEFPEIQASLQSIAQYAELCKIVSYKGSQVLHNENLFITVVALLLDATEMLSEMTKQLNTLQDLDAKKFLSVPFLDRLRWVSTQFESGLRSTVALGNKPDQTIENLLKNLGF